MVGETTSTLPGRSCKIENYDSSPSRRGGGGHSQYVLSLYTFFCSFHRSYILDNHGYASWQSVFPRSSRRLETVCNTLTASSNSI